MKLGAEETIHAGGLRWNAAVVGPDDGPPALLLHGFPEQWRSWRKQLPTFAEAGMRTIAVDLPGYAGTDEPDDYGIPALAEHTAGLARHIAEDGVHLVGHDWGAIIAHAVAARHPEVVRSLVVASSPHPDVMGRALRDLRQIGKSWYILLFQIPLIEYVAGTGYVVDRVFGGASAGVHNRDDLRRAIQYYRSNLAPWQLRREPLGRIACPGLVIHGGKDNYLGEELMTASCEMFDDLRAFEILDGGHYIHRYRADDFNRLVIEFWRELGLF